MFQLKSKKIHPQHRSSKEDRASSSFLGSAVFVVGFLKISYYAEPREKTKKN